MNSMNLKKKVCIVTGSSSGIGKQTALELAKRGATVILICRNRSKGEQAQKYIIDESNNKNVDLIIADLSSLSDVKEAATTFKNKYNQLHILINNAGGVNAQNNITSEGIEYTFATNYLGPLLLTELLIDLLKSSAPSRIINVSSAAHVGGTINFDDLNNEKKYQPMPAYTQSKLAQIYYTYSLSNRLKGTNVTVNALHPGNVRSNFNNGLKGSNLMYYINSILYSLIGISTEQGAKNTVYVATASDLESTSGKYFSNKKQIKSSKKSYDSNIGDQLWEISKKLIQPYL